MQELIILNSGGDFKIVHDKTQGRLRIDTAGATKQELKELMVLVKKAKKEGDQKVYESGVNWIPGTEVKTLKSDMRYVMFSGPKNADDLMDNFTSFLKTKEKLEINTMDDGINVATKPIRHGC